MLPVAVRFAVLFPSALRLALSEVSNPDEVRWVFGGGLGSALRGVEAESFRRSRHVTSANASLLQLDEKSSPDKADKDALSTKIDAGFEVQFGDGSCLTNQRFVGRARAPVVTRCNTRRDQRWHFIDEMLMSEDDQECITLNGSSGVSLQPCMKVQEQLWVASEGIFRSKSADYGDSCLEVAEHNQDPQVDFFYVGVGQVCNNQSQKFRVKIALPRATIIHEDANCAQGPTYLGTVETIEQCVQRVHAEKGWYINFGKLGVDRGKCFKVMKMLSEKNHRRCTPMFENHNFDFLYIEPGTEAELLSFDAICGAAETDMGDQPTLESCLSAVQAQGGRFFVYGKGNASRRCLRKSTASRECKEGLLKSNSYDFWEIMTLQHLVSLEAKVIKDNVVCLSGNQPLGEQKTPLDCMRAMIKYSSSVQAKAVGFFSYGKGAEDEKCLEEYTASAMCNEGFEPDPRYDFYEVDITEGELVKTNVACKSRRVSLGMAGSPEECLAKGKKNEARFVSYGKFGHQSECYKDFAASRWCPEGWETAPFDLYRVVTTEVACQMPGAIDHASHYSCVEGLQIAHGEQCTPSCEPGYKADVEALVCRDGMMEPRKFSCEQIDNNLMQVAIGNDDRYLRADISSKQDTRKVFLRKDRDGNGASDEVRSRAASETMAHHHYRHKRRSDQRVGAHHKRRLHHQG